MEPLDDEELSELLRQWTAPPAPASLGRRIRSRRVPWWRWLLTGTVRIPVPVGLAAVVLAAVWFYLRRIHSPCSPAGRSVGVAGGLPAGGAT